MQDRETDPVDVGRQTAEFMLEEALQKQNRQASYVLPPKGNCWNCDEPLPGGIEGGLRFCMNYDKKGNITGSDCRDDYNHRIDCKVRNGR